MAEINHELLVLTLLHQLLERQAMWILVTDTVAKYGTRYVALQADVRAFRQRWRGKPRTARHADQLLALGKRALRLEAVVQFEKHLAICRRRRGESKSNSSAA